MKPQFNTPELLEEIFQLLARKDLLQCALVCRSWQVTASRLYYKNLTLSKDLPQLLSLLQKQSTGSSFGNYVHTVTLRLPKNQSSEKQFLELLSYLVSLKEVFLQSGDMEFYFDCLSKGSGFLQLENIDFGIFPRDKYIKNYLKCIYLYRPSLEHMCL